MSRSDIIHLLQMEDGRLCQVYQDFHVLYRAETTLEVTVLQGTPPPGKIIESAEMELPEGFKLSLTGNKKGFLLKRLSDKNYQSIVSVEKYHADQDADGQIVRFRQEGQLNARYIWGTGERYHQVNQQGSYSSGAVTEQFTQQGEKTYLPIPFFMTEQGVGCFVNSAIAAEFNFRDGFSVSQQVHGSALSQDIWFFGKPSDILRQFVQYTGESMLPPEWAFGVWISANGWNCDEEVDKQLSALKQYDYPADVMVLEAWSDERTFYLWNNHELWKKPEETVQNIRKAGLHLVLWQIPVIKREKDGDPGEQLQADEQEAIERGLCVKRSDGAPYRIPEGLWFSGSLLPDFTNPETVTWWFGKRQHLLDMGIEGFKTDGGEFLYDPDVRLFNGVTGIEAHNLYPSQYISAYHEFMKQSGLTGLTFSRADYIGAQTRPLHWAGDQLSTWSELRAQLNAGITAGLSGVLFWGFDIGGFAGELPSAELYLRATALGCFSPIMQWHAEPRSGQFFATHEDGFNNDRSPWNLSEKLGDPGVLEIGILFAKLRKKLQPYLIREAEYCVASGRPLMAHLCLDYPDDETACACEDQYMLGRDLMICPITQEGQISREIWIPQGRWRHLFTSDEYSGNQHCSLSCPLDEVIVLKRGDADVFA